MTRSYTLKRRAEKQEQTRRRIVEAAVDLHGTLGPSRTSLSMVAERAGVQRNTLYAHFPDERSLAMACSALSLELAPPPNAMDWRGFDSGRVRLRAGLSEVYGWYGRNAGLLGCVLRDAEHHALTQEVAELRFGPHMAAWREVLGEGLSDPQRAMLRLGLSFHTWRALVREAGLAEAAAVEAMVNAIVGAGP